VLARFPPLGLSRLWRAHREDSVRTALAASIRALDEIDAARDLLERSIDWPAPAPFKYVARAAPAPENLELPALLQHQAT
jgi:hypothetical protein